eukprot:3986228-Prymnesium_polylepis.1
MHKAAARCPPDTIAQRLFDHTEVSDHTGSRVRLPRFTRLKTRADGTRKRASHEYCASQYGGE